VTIYPLDPSSRQKQRDQVRQEARRRLTADMERAVAQVGVSMKCDGYSIGPAPRHADQAGGCANDGTTCLCECHDRP
jgi:hypothetical protein